MYVCVFFAFKINNPILLHIVTLILDNRQVHLCSHSVYNLKKKSYRKDFPNFSRKQWFHFQFPFYELKRRNRIQCDQKCFGNIMIGNIRVYSFLGHICATLMKPFHVVASSFVFSCKRNKIWSQQFLLGAKVS